LKNKISVTKARDNIYKLVKEVADSHEPTYITAPNGNVVLIAEDDFRSMQETLYLLSIPGMRESILEGKDTPIEECFGEEDLAWNTTK
jgi:prevent-host-death family protein